jgi:hypothetical protein
VLAKFGNHVESRTIIDGFAAEDFRAIPRNLNWPLTIAVVSEAVACLADVGRAGALYRLILELADDNVSGGGNVICLGSGSHFLGILAQCLSDQEAAIDHLSAARYFNTSHGLLPSATRSTYRLALVLMHPGPHRNIPQAIELLREAVQTAERLGLHSINSRIQPALQACLAEPAS